MHIPRVNDITSNISCRHHFPFIQLTKMGRIELVTQPSKENIKEGTLRENTMQKLHKLVNETLEDQDTDQDEEKVGQKREKEDHVRSEKSGLSSETHVDHDGFEVPTGKIPLDGNFSTREVKEIIELAQEEGVLQDNINVEVLGRSSFGNRVVVTEKEQQEKDKKEREEKEAKDKDSEEKKEDS